MTDEPAVLLRCDKCESEHYRSVPEIDSTCDKCVEADFDKGQHATTVRELIVQLLELELDLPVCIEGDGRLRITKRPVQFCTKVAKGPWYESHTNAAEPPDHDSAHVVIEW